MRFSTNQCRFTFLKSSQRYFKYNLIEEYTPIKRYERVRKTRYNQKNCMNIEPFENSDHGNGKEDLYSDAWEETLKKDLKCFWESMNTDIIDN
jgi:hypothetical protein